MYIDRETIIHAAATLFVLGALVFIVALALRIWQKRERPAEHALDISFDIKPLLDTLDRIEAKERALGNSVVRLKSTFETLEDVIRLKRELEALEQFECRPVREAWEIIEREMAK